ncbi:MAG TPA: hypothetical protein GX700_09150 [Paracoccus sp.]|nr:hypothetical protein [Paracoccus sp. (in: a-proteobacteria)]
MSDKATPTFKEAFPGLILIGLIVWGGWFLFLKADPAEEPAPESASTTVPAEGASPEFHSVAAETSGVKPQPVPAIIDRSDLVFSMTENHNVRLVATNPEEPISVYVRDMRPEVNGYVICPDVEIMSDVRFAAGSDDPRQLGMIAAGKGCLVASDGWGYAHAVHILNFIGIRFRHLVGNDFDTGTRVELEDPDQLYWAASFQVGTMPANDRLKPLTRAAFR